MKQFLKFFFSFLMLGIVDAGGGAADDRGDDFTPTDDDAADAKTALELAEANKVAADKVAADKAAADKAADKGDDKDDADKDEEGKDDADDKDDKKGKRDTRIPLARHEAILKRERDARAGLEAKVKQYEGGQRVAVTNQEITESENKITALEQEYSKLVVDGDHTKAAEKMAEIRRLDKSISDKKMIMVQEATHAQAVESVRYDTAVDRLEAAYPELNPEHEDYDKDIAKEVLELSNAFQIQGYTPANAIQKAAKTLLGVETKKQESAVDVKPKVDDKDVQKKVAEERKAAATKKALETSGKQPASTAKVGADSDKHGGTISAKDVLKMKQDDFAKLDEETLSRMRGDTL